MRRCTFVALLALLCLDIIVPPAFADKRVALVIGNSAYRSAPFLPNPRNDAQDVAAALKRSGFETILGVDLDKAGMEEIAIKFARAARGADVAMFYYSGHGMQFGGTNYLVPVDATLTDEADLRRLTKVDDIVADLQQAKSLRILVLDACRDNPLATQLERAIGRQRAVSIQRGFAKMDSPEGMIVAYSTQAGNTAEDGRGRNSPYTAAFLRHIEEPDEIGTVFRRVATDVYDTTGRVQLPELSLSLIGEFYLRGRLDVTVHREPPISDPCAAAGDHWKSAEAIGTVAAFEDHMARFANCSFAGLARARIAALTPPAVPAGDVRRFDGMWITTVACDGGGQLNVRGYSLRFVGRVKNGDFRGEMGLAGKPGWTVFTGKIDPDGDVEIQAEGLTGGDVTINLNHMGGGLPFGWRAAGHFEGTHGKAIRSEGRTCNLDLAKQIDAPAARSARPRERAR
jgi:Caspase domain